MSGVHHVVGTCLCGYVNRPEQPPRGDERTSPLHLGFYVPFSTTGNRAPRSKADARAEQGKYEKKPEYLVVPERKEMSRNEGHVAKCPRNHRKGQPWWGNLNLNINQGSRGL